MRPSPLPQLPLPIDFNPRTHVGCDTCPAAPGRPRTNFNPRTHVGCDFFGSPARIRPSHFNPRTHVGCDLACEASLPGGESFQSTHPRGVRQGRNRHPYQPRTFQSTHPRGVRLTSINRLITYILFQSTHPRGVRRGTSRWILLNIKISIHAPTWGATVKPSNGWLLGHKDNEFANENIIIINSVNIT